MRGFLGVIGFLLDVWAVVSIVNSNAERRTKIIWVLVVAFLPVLGFLVYSFSDISLSSLVQIKMGAHRCPRAERPRLVQHGRLHRPAEPARVRHVR